VYIVLNNRRKNGGGSESSKKFQVQKSEVLKAAAGNKKLF
jgi:hypothetical protein